MFSKYFALRYFPSNYYSKGAQNNPFYSNSGDIKSKLIQDYSKSGDIETIIGFEFSKKGDIKTSILKRKPQVYMQFEFDVETELT